MEVTNLRIAQVFSGGGDIHYVLPLFQREYTWDKTNWETLLNDLYAIYSEYVDDKVPEHFMGSLVVVQDGMRKGVIPAFRLVDGQQRLTTISLMLCALKQIVTKSHLPLASRINNYLLNADEGGGVHYKLFPTTKYGDRAFYTALLDNADLPQVQSKMREAYDYLYRELNKKITSGEVDPERFFVIITTSLQVVLINLNANESPYQIFESLDAKGKPLTQADLVRNYIAMKVTAIDQEAVYYQHWAKMEELLQEQETVGRSGIGELTAFLRHYLAMESGVLANQAHVYARFRDRMEQDIKTSERVMEELSTLHRFARYYDKLLRPEHEHDEAVQASLQRLNIMEAGTAYPFLLALYNAHDTGGISREEFLEALAAVENYLIRRYLAGEAINYLTKMFPTLWRAVDVTALVPSLRVALASRNYPTDSRIRQAILSRPFYENKSGSRDKLVLVLSAVNQRLARFQDVEQSLKGAATIEHVLPQTPPAEWTEKWKTELGADWQQFYDDYLQWQTDLGEDWEPTYRECLHTLGNLTLVTQKWQLKLSNKPFAIKKVLLAGQGLHLNTYFNQDIQRWDEVAIRERANALADEMLELWPALAAPPLSSSSGSKFNAPKRTWDETSTLADIQAKQGPDEAAVAERILNWAKSCCSRIWWSINSTEGSFVPTYNHNGKDYQLFVIRASGVEIYFFWYQFKPPFDNEEMRLNLLSRLNAIPGVSIPPAAITKRPSFPLVTLKNELALHQFLETFEWFIEEIKGASPNPADNGIRPLQQSQLEYWTAFYGYLHQGGSSVTPNKPLPQHWMSFAIGRSHFTMDAVLDHREKQIAICLIISGPDRLPFFHLLEKEDAAIEQELNMAPNVELEWLELADKKASRVYLIRRNSDSMNSEEWPAQFQWLKENLEQFHQVFSPRVKVLNAADYVVKEEMNKPK